MTYRTRETALWPFYLLIALLAACMAVPVVGEIWTTIQKAVGGF